MCTLERLFGACVRGICESDRQVNVLSSRITVYGGGAIEVKTGGEVHSSTNSLPTVPVHCHRTREKLMHDWHSESSDLMAPLMFLRVAAEREQTLDLRALVSGL